MVSGLVTTYQGRVTTNSCSPSSQAMAENDYTWAWDSANNQYIGATYIWVDKGYADAQEKETTQTLDQYGNVTNAAVYNWGSLSSPYRTYGYTYTYQSPYPNWSAYASRYIFNRLATSSVTDNNGVTATTVSNTYDGGTLRPLDSIPYEWDSSYGSVTVRGNVTQSITPTTTTLTAYDQTGTAASVTVNGIQSSISTSTATNYTLPDSIMVNQLTSRMSYTGFLGLSGQTDPNNQTVSLGYDAMNRPTSVTSPLDGMISTVYNDTASPPNSLTTYPVDAHWTQTNFDGLGGRCW